MPPRASKTSVKTEETHIREREWNGLTQHDRCLVSGGRRGSNFTFWAKVTAPGGSEYIEVLEQQSRQGPRLWRAFPMERVSPIPPKRSKRHR